MEQEACAAALAALPGIGPATLQRLLAGGDPVGVWAAVRAGEVVRPCLRRQDERRPSWQVLAARVDAVAQWQRWSAAGVGVTWWGDDAYPARLVDDPEPPGVLFVLGDLGRLAGPCVAVVGTRRCTPAGRSCAYHLGRDLAGAGVCVVSGLALGVDGAAHQGAVAAVGPGGTVGVAASGVDVVYPPRHADLWAEVARRGAILSETPPGGPAQAWRFPSRNRVIAGLADALVVVESHAAGGSMLSVDAALARGVEVLAVPGPVGSPAAEGTNQLLVDGAAPARDATDVLDALGLFADGVRRSGRTPVRPPRMGRSRQPSLPLGGPSGREGPPSGGTDPTPLRAAVTYPVGPAVPGGSGPAVSGQDRPPQPGTARDPDPGRRSRVRAAVGPGDAAVLDAVGWTPTSVARIVARCGRPVGAVAAALDRLERCGAARDDGGWWSRLC